MNNDKKYNIVLGLMIFFFILFVAVCIAWGLGFIGINKSNVETNDNEFSSADNIKKEEIEDESQNKIENTISNVNLINIHTDKCLNVSAESSLEFNAYTNSEYKYYADLEWFTIKYDKNQFVMSLANDGYVDKNRNEFGVNIQSGKEFAIQGLEEEKVADVSANVYAHEFTNILITFLMEDGTVYWIDVMDAFVKEDFSAQKIANVSGVVKIVSASAGAEGEGGGRTILALRNDGTFYDLTLETVNKQ